MSRTVRNRLLSIILAVTAAGGIGCTRGKVSADSRDRSRESGIPSATQTPAQPVAEVVPAPAPPPPEPLILAEGTPIKVRTTNTISTRTARAGDTFGAVLEEPLMAGDVMIADRGSVVEGVVSESNPGGRIKHKAFLELRLARLHTANGVVPVNTNERAKQARATKRRDGLIIGLGAAVGAGIGALAGGGKGAAIGAGAGGAGGTGIVLGTRGVPAVIPAESVLTFRLRTPVEIG